MRSSQCRSRNCHLSRVRFHRPPTQCNLRGADEAVLNKVLQKIQKYPFCRIFWRFMYKIKGFTSRVFNGLFFSYLELLSATFFLRCLLLIWWRKHCWLSSSAIAGSRFSITNIRANSKPKSKIGFSNCVRRTYDTDLHRKKSTHIPLSTVISKKQAKTFLFGLQLQLLEIISRNTVQNPD